MKLWLFVVGVFFLSSRGDGKRPELLDSSIWYTPNATLLNLNFDAAVVQMDFDQPLYTNGHTFLCPDSDIPCPELSCKPCDWSGQEPTGCDDPTCCGPAQSGDIEAAEAWCDSDSPAYETLKIGEISKRYTLNQGEEMYVRFFVPEEYYCRPIIVIPRPFYGTVTSSFSTLVAYPSWSTITGWRKGLNRRFYGFGQSSVLICPNTTIHPEYNIGTFSGMIYGVVATSFEIEIVVSPQTYPLPPPSNRLSCDDVPDEVMEYAGTYEPAFCVEDGTTQIYNSTQTNLEINQQVTVVLPIPKGCHTLSFVSISVIPSSPEIAHHIFCLPTDAHSSRSLSNSGLFRLAASGQNMVLSACFEEDVTYMFCTLRLFREEPVHFSFSSVSDVVRRPVMDLPDASLAMMDGYQNGWAATFGQSKYPCIDFYAGCYDWMLPPSDNALSLFPPPAAPQLDTEQTYEDLQEFYRNAGLQEKKENRLSLVILFKMGSVTPIVKNTSSLSLIITALTNKDGELVKLPGGGIDTNPASVAQYSISKFVEHIPLSAIPDFEIPRCDTEKYTIYQQIVADRLVAVGETSQLSYSLSLKYSLDAMNEGVLARSCTEQVSDNLETFRNDVVLSDTVDCYYDFGTISWFVEPCCNVFLSLVSCCLPFDINATEYPFGTVADVSDCGEPECAQSYYDDLSFSLNNLGDPFLGCTSGIQNPTSSLGSAIFEALKDQYLVCLANVGFGDFYQGVSCRVDSDCDNLSGICSNNLCILAPLDEVENEFLDCYIDNMPSYLESYIKRNVLSPDATNYDKDSQEFYEAIREAATVPDCINPTNTLDIDHRTRYQSRPVDYACIALANDLMWPEQAEEAYEACPGEPCLRGFSCLINVSSCIFRLCDGFEQALIEVKEEDCPLEEECNIEVDDDCDGSYCVFCPENGDLPCQKVENFDNEEDCENGVACELPDGSVSFTMTEEECRQYGEGCTVDCVGNSCESIYKLPGACSVPTISSSSDCSTYSASVGVTTEWFKDSLCVLPEILMEDECDMLIGTQWDTCQENPLSNCDANTSQKQFLGCYESLWHVCPDKEECERSGMCTDRYIYVTVHSYDPVNVQYGACMGSGEYVADTRPACGTIASRVSLVGCKSQVQFTEAECTVKPSPFYFIKWVDVALTEEQCLSKETGRAGCQLYQDRLDILLWILDDDECHCKGGVPLNAFDWIEGVWQGGVPRNLEWKKASKATNYEYTDALSFIILADWIQQSAEENFLFPVQSQIICESQSITTPINVLVCDCLADGGEICYQPGEQQKEIQMGLSQVCAGETRFVKDPSAQVNFGTKSVSDGCSFLNISLIHRNWFAAPFVPPPLSFKWQDQREGGVVLNGNGATVGEVLGDGVVLTFSKPDIIGIFDVCLRLNTDPSGVFDEIDFGYTNDELQFIYPLGSKNVYINKKENAGTWYCVPFDFEDTVARTTVEGETIRLFPINRLEDYEGVEDQYTDDTTRALCYTLGALYCSVGVGCLIGLIAFASQTVKHTKPILSLPNFCTLTFLILCIFRAVFMFLYPKGTFEFQPLSYFVIFEIPTFLLFSTLIFMIYSFKKLVYKKGFFPGNPWPILAVGWPLVWGLWVIVTIVYSEVILDGSSGTSPCEGRVEVSYEDEEDDTRKLAIAYQTVIIAITIVLASIFFYFTFLMYSATKKKTSSAKQFVIVVGGSFNISFFFRTVLFLVILVIDFASSVYLFCTLFFTEILMMIFILIQFNLHYFKALATALSDSGFSGSSGSNSSGIHS